VHFLIFLVLGVMDFFNYITYNHCHIMAMIYLELFESLGLKTYNSDEMILVLS
jgi:hypothetical protein